MQTAIVFRNGDDELLVRIANLHVPANVISVDVRPWLTMSSSSWTPIDPALIEVRMEGSIDDIAPPIPDPTPPAPELIDPPAELPPYDIALVPIPPDAA